MNIKYGTHVTKQSNKSSNITLHSKFIFRENITKPPRKPNLLLHKLISWISLLEIMKFIHAYFKTFKNHERCENGLSNRKWQPILLKEMGFLVPKNSRIEKKCEVGII